MGTNAGPAAGVAVIFATILAITLWKGSGKRWPAWLALATGLTGSYIVLGWLGSLATLSIYGVGIITLAVIGCGLTFWHEAVKGKKAHKIRTPVIGFVLGVALMAGTGGVHNIVQHGTANLTSVIKHGETKLGGSR